jgi:methionine-rich copper-binding protein CopC
MDSNLRSVRSPSPLRRASLSPEQSQRLIQRTRNTSVALNALTPGVYTVAWIAVADDGHHTQGHYGFTVK